MWSLKVTYSNVLTFLITLGSASAVASSSPIPVHWYLSKSRLKEYNRRKIDKIHRYIQLHIITVLHFIEKIQHSTLPLPPPSTFLHAPIIGPTITYTKTAWSYSTDRSIQSINQFTTHFSTSSDLLCCSALTRATAPVAVRSLFLRLQWDIMRHEHTWVRCMFQLLWQWLLLYHQRSQ